MERVEDTFDISRKSTQLIDLNKPSSMPRKKQLCKPINFVGSIFDKRRNSTEVLYCPKETRSILRKLSVADENVKVAFDSCCRMYMLSLNLGYEYPTAMLSYRIAAVESIVKVMKYKSFTDFMSTYLGEDKKFYDSLYGKVRSGHFHSGDFLFEDAFRQVDYLSNRENFIVRSFIEESKLKLRLAILRWLDEMLEITNI